MYAYVLYIVDPPMIVEQPSSEHIDLSQVAKFTCLASGYKVRYHWKIGTGSFPNKISSVSSNTLVIPDIKSSDDNSYTCVASNEGGSVSSNPTRLTVTGMKTT